MGRGSNTATVVDIKLIFAVALAVSACGIIVSHNQSPIWQYEAL